MKGYVRSVWTAFRPEERAEMRGRMVGLARGVAEAAGGFLGLTSKISPSERAVLQDMASYEQTQETLALLKVLALGVRQVEQGRVVPAREVVALLRERIAAAE